MVLPRAILTHLVNFPLYELFTNNKHVNIMKGKKISFDYKYLLHQQGLWQGVPLIWLLEPLTCIG